MLEVLQQPIFWPNRENNNLINVPYAGTNINAFLVL
jgi:hypothetical protein